MVEFLELGYPVRLRVTGQSMAPSIQSGDMVLVEPVDPTALDPGDVVVCRDGFGRIRIHRLVQGAPGSAPFITRGDNLSGNDRPKEASEILGRVVAVQGSWSATAAPWPGSLPLGALARPARRTLIAAATSWRAPGRV